MIKKKICLLLGLILLFSALGCAKQESDTDQNVVDLMIFMGQSNMAGRGVTSKEFPEPAPDLIDGAGYEFRAISDPTRLYPIEEPFGVNENQGGSIGEPDKTGSLVTAFANAYYKQTKVPIVAVSASVGGTDIHKWQPDGDYFYFEDAMDRWLAANQYLTDNEYTIRHSYMVWCQGESDADNGTSAEDYKAGFDNILNAMKNEGVEKCFMIQIGECNVEGQYDLYNEIQACQEEIAKENEDVIMVSTLFSELRDRGLMKDTHHYYQQGYNEVGTDAGKNAGKYVKSLK